MLIITYLCDIIITERNKKATTKQEGMDMREWNKILNEYGYDVCGAAWCDGCYDIFKMDESCIPEHADCTEEFVEEFIKKLTK